MVAPQIFKKRATSNMRAKRAEKKWSTAELLHLVLCVFRYFMQFAIEKNLPPVFNFVISPHFFPGDICLHGSMEWTPLFVIDSLIDLQ